MPNPKPASKRGPNLTYFRTINPTKIIPKSIKIEATTETNFFSFFFAKRFRKFVLDDISDVIIPYPFHAAEKNHASLNEFFFSTYTSFQRRKIRSFPDCVCFSIQWRNFAFALSKRTTNWQRCREMFCVSRGWKMLKLLEKFSRAALYPRAHKVVKLFSRWDYRNLRRR